MKSICCLALLVISSLFASSTIKEFVWIGAVPTGSIPVGMAIDSNNEMAYVANFGSNNVTPIDLKTMQAHSAVPVGACPSSIALVNSKMALVVNSMDSTLSEIDLESLTISKTLSAGDAPSSIAVNAKGSMAYLVCQGISDPHLPPQGGYLIPIVLPAASFLQPIPLGNTPLYIAMTTSSRFAYVANFGDDTITPIDLQAGRAHPPIQVGRGAIAIAITPDDVMAYVVNKLKNSVTPIKLSERRLFPEIPVGNTPQHIAITPNGKYAFVANQADNTITPIDLRTKKPLPSFSSGGKGPSFIAITKDSGKLCVLNEESNNLSIYKIVW